jgi:hypothetical protein
MMSHLKPGIYQGGGAAKFAKDLGVEGDDILYIGDHIYGDILRLKKDCNWRTALVVEELDSELENYIKAQPFSAEIRVSDGQKGAPRARPRRAHYEAHRGL